MVDLIYNTTSWVCPAGVTQVIVECWGGGGAGGKGGGSNKNGGGGGGGGGYSRLTVNVTPSNSYSCWIGGGGGTTTGDGNPGGTTVFSDSVNATGGSGGKSYANGAAGGAGGSGTTSGGANYTGGSGSAGSATYSGSGGGGAGSSGNGDSAGAYNDPGSATADYGGAGGLGSNSNSSAGGAGSVYGGGGGGATKTGIPGVGAPGLIRITYGVALTNSSGNETLQFTQSVSTVVGKNASPADTISISDNVTFNHVAVSTFYDCAIRYYDGTTWIRGILKRWTGSAWIVITPKVNQ